MLAAGARPIHWLLIISYQQPPLPSQLTIGRRQLHLSRRTLLFIAGFHIIFFQSNYLTNHHRIFHHYLSVHSPTPARPTIVIRIHHSGYPRLIFTLHSLHHRPLSLSGHQLSSYTHSSPPSGSPPAIFLHFRMPYLIAHRQPTCHHHSTTSPFISSSGYRHRSTPLPSLITIHPSFGRRPFDIVSTAYVLLLQH